MQIVVRSAVLVLTLLSVAGLPIRSMAQGPASTDSTAGKKITVDVVVHPKDAKLPPAGGLSQGDFSVLDNGNPRTLTSFREVTTGHEQVRVVLLIDAVNIRTQGLAQERIQATKFLRANGGHLKFPTTIAILTDAGLKMQEAASTDGNALSDALQQQEIGLRTIRDDTGFYGAVDRVDISLNALRNLAAQVSRFAGRTAVMWISPGWPLLSGPGVQLGDKDQLALFKNIVALSTQLREARVTLYAIDTLGSNESLGRTFYYEGFVKGVAKPTQVDEGDLSLQVLALQSGGLALNSNDASVVLEKSVADLDDYYEISFEAPPAENRDTYHHLEIKLDKPGLTARTRDGFYTQP